MKVEKEFQLPEAIPAQPREDNTWEALMAAVALAVMLAALAWMWF